VASFRTAVVVTVIVGFVLGMLLGMSAGSELGQPAAALAADTNSVGGVLKGLAQTIARPLVKALNLAGGPTVKVVDPSAKGERNAATTPKQDKGVERPPKP
jgi:hypothetical protein